MNNEPHIDGMPEAQHETERYATRETWARELQLEHGTIAKRLREVAGILGISQTGRLRTFYAESEVRERCADLLLDLPRADESGFFELQGERYGTVARWAEEFGRATGPSVYARLKDAPSIQGRDSSGQIGRFYTRATVEQYCADLLEDLPEPGADGFVVIDSVRYANVEGWAKLLGVGGTALRVRLGDAKGIAGRSKGSRCTLYPESVARDVVAHLLTEMPRADEKGFFVKEEMRYGSIKAWSTELGLARPTIRKKLSDIDAKGITGKNIANGVVENGYFSETDVRTACAELLKEVPTENEEGFIIIEGERYGCGGSWEKELGITRSTLKKRMQDVPAITGRTRKGLVLEKGFYPESAVLRLCADFINKDMPQADERGFFTITTAERGNVRYGTCHAWGLEMGGVAGATIRKRVANFTGYTAKDSLGRVLPNAFFPEYLIQETCADLQDTIPRAGEDGFVMLAGQRYATSDFWAETLGLVKPTVRDRTKKLTGITARNRQGRVMMGGFYVEEDVRMACADILEDLPQADSTGFFTLQGDISERCGSIEAWSRELKRSHDAIKLRLEGRPTVRGRGSTGRVGTFYSASVVMQACADLLLPTFPSDGKA